MTVGIAGLNLAPVQRRRRAKRPQRRILGRGGGSRRKAENEASNKTHGLAPFDYVTFMTVGRNYSIVNAKIVGISK
jgi:hypothetical protein